MDLRQTYPTLSKASNSLDIGFDYTRPTGGEAHTRARLPGRFSHSELDYTAARIEDLTKDLKLEYGPLRKLKRPVNVQITAIDTVKLKQLIYNESKRLGLRKSLAKALLSKPDSGIIRSLLISWFETQGEGVALNIINKCLETLLRIDGPNFHEFADSLLMMAVAKSSQAGDNETTSTDIPKGNEQAIRLLAMFEANPCILSEDHWRYLIRNDVLSFKTLLCSKHKLPDRLLETFCREIITFTEDLDAIGMVLRRATAGGFNKNLDCYDRDRFLSLSLDAPKLSMFVAIIAVTHSLLLNDFKLFTDVLELTSMSPQRDTAIELLCCISPPHEQLKDWFSSFVSVVDMCTKQNDERMLSKFVLYQMGFSGHRSQSEQATIIRDLLNVVLERTMTYEDTVSCSAHSNDSQAHLEKFANIKTMKKVVRDQVKVPDLDALINNAKQDGQSSLVVSLFKVRTLLDQRPSHSLVLALISECQEQLRYYIGPLRSIYTHKLCSDIELLDSRTRESLINLFANEFPVLVADKNLLFDIYNNKSYWVSASNLRSTYLLLLNDLNNLAVRILQKRFNEFVFAAGSEHIVQIQENTSLWIRDSTESELEQIWMAYSKKRDHGPFACHLLLQYFEACTYDIGSFDLWPQEIVRFLQRMAENSSEQYFECIRLVMSSKQWKILRLLLRTPFSEDTFEKVLSLHAQQIAASSDSIEAFFDLAEQISSTDETFSRLIAPLFLNVQESKLALVLDRSVKSRWNIRVTDVLESITRALEVPLDTHLVTKFLEIAITTSTDLAHLWKFIWARKGHLFQLWAPILLRIYKGSEVVRALMECAQNKTSHQFASIILQNAQIEIPANINQNFNCLQLDPMPFDVNKLEHTVLSHELLSDVLLFAIQHRNLDMIRVLCEYKPLFMSHGRCLVEEAVISWPKSQMEIEITIRHSPLQHASCSVRLSCGLIHAMTYEDNFLTIALLNLGASTAAFDHHVWKLASKSEKSDLLQMLLNYPNGNHKHDEIRKVFREVFTPVFSTKRKTNQWCKKMEVIVDSGFRDQELASWALVLLCGSEWATPGRAKLLLRMGASTDYQNGECLRKLLGHREIVADTSATFKYLFRLCCNKTRQLMFFDWLNRVSTHQSETSGLRFWPSSNLVDLTRHMAPPHPGYFSKRTLKKRISCGLRTISMAEGMADDVWAGIQEVLLRSGDRFTLDMCYQFYRCHCLDKTSLTTEINCQAHHARLRSGAILYLFRELSAGEFEPYGKRQIFSRPVHPERVLLNIVPRTTELHNFEMSQEDTLTLFQLMVEAETGITVGIVRRFFMEYQRFFRRHTPCSQQTYLEFLNLIERAISEASQPDHASRIIEVLKALRYITADDDVNHVHALSFGPRQFDSLCMWAIQHGRDSLASWLLKEGEYGPNLRQYSFQAVKLDLTETIQEAINRGIRECKPFQVGAGIFLCALRRRSHLMLKLLLTTFPEPGFRFDGPKLLGTMCHFERTCWGAPNLTETIEVLRACQNDAWSRFRIQDHHIVRFLWEALDHSQVAFRLLSALLSSMKQDSAEVKNSISEIRVRGRFAYSLVSFVEYFDGINLPASERESLSQKLRELGFYPVFYAVEGEQPLNAIRVPAHILGEAEARERRIAFETQECSVQMGCGDELKESDIHAGLVPACAKIHGWKDGIICAGCLRDMIVSRMFVSDDNGNVNRNFANLQIHCWAPKCQQTVLDLATIAKFVDVETFRQYDYALLQQHLRDGASIAKCARAGCIGASWYDKADDPDLKIYFCRECHENTCLTCNSLYSTHEGRPCPADESAKNERKKKDEELSQKAMQNMRCPNCGLAYEKVAGCDEIKCGMNAHDKPGTGKVKGGCEFSFCHVCKAGWRTNAHKPSCIYHRLGM